MCGIAGLISATPIAAAQISAMTDAIAYRGPDDSGLWLSPDARIGLGHRRLSIVDLSASGHQPMASADQRYIVCYNGEIYNHVVLRRDIERAGGGPARTGNPWHGHSDTETLLEGISIWGLDATIARAAGMFAIALWDTVEQSLTLVRDRYGEKPLYFGWTRAGFAFASELKAIRALAGFDNAINPQAVRCLLGRGYIPAPLSIYHKIFKLLPGTSLTVDASVFASPCVGMPLSDAAGSGWNLRRYYSHHSVVATGAANPMRSEEEALVNLETTLTKAVGDQLAADVPVGTFLSGGIDSSLITALATRASSQRVRTFSLGFHEAGFDEAHHARDVATHLGTDHHELYVTADDARTVIPLLAAMYDEPFADSSQIPTYLVSRFARTQVTVSLSGDAGDELFGGYNRYIGFPRLWRAGQRVPTIARKWGLSAMAQVSPAMWNTIGGIIANKTRPDHFGHKIQRTMQIMGRSSDFPAMFDSFLDEWSGEESPVVGFEHSSPFPTQVSDALSTLPLELQMMAYDAETYLPDDILCKVDRAAMAVSLEGRVPFLDHNVVAVAASIPPEMLFSRRGGKSILRTLLYQHAPRTLFERPKAGFAVPVGQWLRGPLREWAEGLLSEAALSEGGLLRATPIRKRWAAHLSGQRDHTQSLWAVLMFQAWRQSL